MNDLYKQAPKCLSIGEKNYKINSDYRTWIEFETLLIKNQDISFSDILSLLFPDELPLNESQEEITEQILWFYRCGQPEDNNSGSKGSQVFDYDFDAGYIYAAFMQQYDLDISKPYIHWWKFRGLFLALDENTEFVKIMGYRSMQISSKMTSEQKSFYTKMKKLHKIPLPQSEQEKCNAIEEALLNGESIDGLL